MKRILKFAYPVLTSILFYLFFFVTAFVINVAFSNDGWGGLGLALLAIALWVLAIIPVVCYFYGKMIRNEKLKWFFAVYNALITALSYIFPFMREDETYQYGLVLFVWVLLWSLVFSSKRKKDIAETESCSGEPKTISRADMLLQNKKHRSVAICFTVIYAIESILFEKIGTILSEHYYTVFLQITPIALVLVFLLSTNTVSKYKHWLLTGAFGIVLLTNINSCLLNFNYWLNYGNKYNHAVSLVFACLNTASAVVMVIGSVCDLKFINLLKYGALSKAVIVFINAVITVFSIFANAETVELAFKRLGLLYDVFLGSLCCILFFVGIFIFSLGKLNSQQPQNISDNE